MIELTTTKGGMPLKKRAYLMGILNVTPDSFSDGGRYDTVPAALCHAKEMAAQGADLIDVGAVSTRPFAAPVSEAEEWGRLKDLLPALLRETSLPVSVDTTSVAVARRCLDMGAAIINDVSGVFRAEMCAVIKEYRAGWVLMHGGAAVSKTGTSGDNGKDLEEPPVAPRRAETAETLRRPATEEEMVYSGGVIAHVQSFFDYVLEQAEAHKLPIEQLCLDPGFGFAKNTAQNAELLRGLSFLDTHGAALMAALSRKRFIGEISGDPDPSDRLGGTLAANVAAVMAGADLIRTHEIALHRKALDTAFALRPAGLSSPIR